MKVEAIFIIDNQVEKTYTFDWESPKAKAEFATHASNCLMAGGEVRTKNVRDYAPYRWVLGGPDSKPTIQGPRTANPELNGHNSRKATFRMKDDDGNVMYWGHIFGDFDGFEPLDDYGMPNAGCTYIEYRYYAIYHKGQFVAKSDCAKEMLDLCAQRNAESVLNGVSENADEWEVKPLEWRIL